MLETIESYAFSSCTSLINIVIPASVIYIGSSAFGGSRSLTIYIEASVQGEWSSDWTDVDPILGPYYNPIVWDCNNNDLDIYGNAYTVVDGVNYQIIDGEAILYSASSNLTQIEIPGSITYREKTYLVKSLLSDAFIDCDNLTSITVDDSNNYFDSVEGVLYDKNLNTLLCYPADKADTSFVVPSIVFYIGDYAFYGCDSLINIEFPGYLIRIGAYAFYGCDSLINIALPARLEVISNRAFGSCRSLTSVTFAEGSQARYIGYSAFVGCRSLTSIMIPENVTYIGISAFLFCDSMTSIQVDKNNQEYSSDERGVLFNKNKTTLIQYPIGNQSDSYIIRAGVVVISSRAFEYCESLTSIEIPASVIVIFSRAFASCRSLTSVTFAEGSHLTSIEYQAFSHCTSLTSIDIPESVTSIGDNVFYQCSLLTVINMLRANSEGVTLGTDWNNTYNGRDGGIIEPTWGYKH